MDDANRIDRALAGLAQIATRFAALTIDLPGFLESVLRTLRNDLGLESCLVILADERGTGRFTVRAGSGLAAGFAGKPMPRSGDVHDRVLRTGRAVLAGHLKPGTRRGDPPFRSCISTPIIAGGRTAGLLNAYRTAQGAFSDHDLNLLAGVANYVGAAMARAHLYGEVSPAAGGAPGDVLPIPVFLDVLERELRRGQRYRAPVTLLCLDMNNLQRLGVARGRALVQAVAGSMRGMCRESDVVAKSEAGCLLLLPETPKRAAAGVAARLRHRAESIVAAGSHPVTLDLRVTAWPEDGASNVVLNAARHVFTGGPTPGQRAWA